MADPKYLRQGFNFCLAHAIEECGEFLAAAGKLQRWGPHSVNPELPREMQESNIDWLFRELLDVQEAMERLRQSVANAEHQRSPTSGDEKHG